MFCSPGVYIFIFLLNILIEKYINNVTIIVTLFGKERAFFMSLRSKIGRTNELIQVIVKSHVDPSKTSSNLRKAGN